MDGILIISFGTTYKKSRENTIDILADIFRETFFDIPVYIAFTSKVILKKIYEEERINIDTVEEAFRRMSQEGITRVFIQSTYIFHKVEKNDKDIGFIINKYRGLFPDGIYIGNALLENKEDYNKIFPILFQELSFMEINVSRETLNDANTAIIVIGHGIYNHNKAYPLDYHLLREIGYKNIYVGAAEGEPSAKYILKEIEKNMQIKNIILVPFFFLVGKHVIRDIAGLETSSWKSIFELAGYQVKCILKGLGEYPEIQEYYVKELQEMIRKVKEKEKKVK